MKTILTATVKGITGVRKEVLPTREAGSPRLFGEGKWRGVLVSGGGWKQCPTPFLYLQMSLEVKLPFQSMLHVLTYSWISKATQVFGISSWEEVIFLSLSLACFFSLGASVTHQALVSIYRILPREKYNPEGKWQQVTWGLRLACWALKFGQNPKFIS